MRSHWNQWRSAVGYSAAQARAARRFRHHLQTNGNPRGRVHREECVREDRHDGARFLPPGEAHHPDYARWALVAWLCEACHRAVERGEFRLRRKDLYDYSSLLITRPKAHKENAQ